MGSSLIIHRWGFQLLFKLKRECHWFREKFCRAYALEIVVVENLICQCKYCCWGLWKDSIRLCALKFRGISGFIRQNQCQKYIMLVANNFTAVKKYCAYIINICRAYSFQSLPMSSNFILLSQQYAFFKDFKLNVCIICLWILTSKGKITGKSQSCHENQSIITKIKYLSMKNP